LLEVLEVLEMVPEVTRCMLLCMLKAVEGRLCLLEVLELLEAIRCVLLSMRKLWRVDTFRWRCLRCQSTPSTASSNTE